MTSRRLVGMAFIVEALGVAAHDRGDANLAAVGITALAVGAAVLERRVARRRNQKRLVIESVEAVLGAAVTARVRWKGRKIEAVSVRYPSKVPCHRESLRAELEAKMIARLGGPVSVKWRSERCSVTIRRTPPVPPLPSFVVHPEVVDGAWHLPIGMAIGGREVALDLRGADPHVLVVGLTRSGKSAVLAGLAVGASRRGCEVRIVDAKGGSLDAFEEWPGVTSHTTDNLAAMLVVIAKTEAEMRERYTNRRDKALDDYPALLLIVDEAAQLLDQCKKADRDAVAANLASIARAGGRSHVHLALGLQRADVRLIGSGEARSNFGCRIALGRMDATARRMVDIRSEVPATPRGRAIVAMAEGEVETQCYWTPSEALGAKDQRALAALRPTTSPWPARTPTHRLRLVPNRPDSAPDQIPPKSGTVDMAKVAKTDKQRQTLERARAKLGQG